MSNRILLISLLCGIFASSNFAEPPDNPIKVKRAEDQAERRAALDAKKREEAEQRRQAELAADQKIRDAGGLVRAKSSGEQWSGDGKEFSGWYFVESDPTPVGYRIQEVVFHLVGDRRCEGGTGNPDGIGAWAECKQVEMNDTRVKWKFRMQGHDERRDLEFKTVKVVFSTDANGRNGTLDLEVQFRVKDRKATSVGILKVRYLPVRSSPSGLGRK